MLHASRLWRRAWQALKEPMRRRYRPEQHQMRGPGPKFRAKVISRPAKTTGALVKIRLNRASERDQESARAVKPIMRGSPGIAGLTTTRHWLGVSKQEWCSCEKCLRTDHPTVSQLAVKLPIIG